MLDNYALKDIFLTSSLAILYENLTDVASNINHIGSAESLIEYLNVYFSAIVMM